MEIPRGIGIFLLCVALILLINPVQSAKCGGAKYNEKTQVCCKGTIQSRVAGESTVCCGTTAYNPNGSVCCDGTLVALTSDPTMNTCCGT
eukprot:CAMPEP_0117804940 /NCGR_PEP_ID=MMETSP0948-20121206/17501_1 /TAXON_ID=44440 /ORGANISM="Chattonella subsalsa, Strain CCMP2191" /LENGTH=89 /DNA_ID=CAMNT_0005638779 /DNA_START=143 /DNA_END=409 /DNA_ORIENTATION=-